MQSQIKAQSNVANSPVKAAATRCAAAYADPAEYAEGGWQGFEFVITLSSCLAAYAANGSANDLATAIKYWSVLLDDYATVGDGLGGDDVVKHDTGYAMRTFAPYSALAYDWLHDAPGVTEELRAHARARFHAWSSYYSTQGYLRDLPGANYQAGYAFAATLMAIAEAGEAGEAGDADWANVRDVIWKKDLAPAFAAGGVLDGGDWPEGWQYGALSVLEHALGARAMQDNGVSISGAADWASSLALRFVYGQTPASQQSFVGGDSDSTTAYRAPANGPLLATILGPSADAAKALARSLNASLQLKNENPLFDVLAAAIPGSAAALPTNLPKSYLARGVGNWYVRSSWTADSAWSVLQCSRRLVDDHQHVDAGNWVLSRGQDDLVVDPSPYGSLSTLTGNAPALDSGSLPSGYSPSQGFWGKHTGWVWTRQSGSGIAAGRCDYADQFAGSDTPSDVSSALRDFVMIPDTDGAQMVLIDRAVTAAPDKALHLRVRSPAALALDGDAASATLGGSSLSIHKIWASSGVGSVRAMPHADECPSSSHSCDVSKLEAGSEYRIDVAGPVASAIHVVNAKSGAAQSAGTLVSGAGYRGVLVQHGGGSVAVIASDGTQAPSAALTYRAPAQSAVHVVVDAPVDNAGKSDVVATRAGADCQVTVTAHTGAAAGLNGRPLAVNVAPDCTVTDDGEQPVLPSATLGSPGDGSLGAGSGSGGGTGAAAASTPGFANGASATSPAASGATEASCAFSFGRSTGGELGGVSIGTLLALVALRRRRRSAQAR